MCRNDIPIYDPRPGPELLFACLTVMAASVTLLKFCVWRYWVDTMGELGLNPPLSATYGIVGYSSPWNWWPLVLTVLFALLWYWCRPWTKGERHPCSDSHEQKKG